MGTKSQSWLRSFWLLGESVSFKDETLVALTMLQGLAPKRRRRKGRRRKERKKRRMKVEWVGR